jgi:NitT/TauT family transport system ATP-binding protein
MSTHLAEKPRAVQGSIRIEHVSVEFRRDGVAMLALKDIELAIEPGEFTALLGPSGCGKSTLLSVIGGMVRPARGEVRIDDTPVTEPTARCGVVFQQHSLFPWMTALGNVAFGPRMLGHASPEAEAREFLALVGLEKYSGAYPAQLSGGMQQRVGIARALATRPPVLLMDEPFGALDAQTRSIMQEELLKIWSKLKTTVVFVTHDVDEALYLADRVFAMTNSPGGIKEEIRVDLGRPRAPEVALSEKYGALHRRVHRLIREESLKVFNGITS